MRTILNFDSFNESFFSSYKYDSIAKDTFSKMLDNITHLDVRKFADYRREATVILDKENKSDDKLDKPKRVESGHTKSNVDEVDSEFIDENVDPNYRIKRRQLKNPERKEIVSKEEEDFKSKNNPSSKNIEISVTKNYSKHRFSSKFWGSRKENDYSLAINGKHFISDIRGEEGKTLVSPKMVQIYWNFLSELSEIQDRYKRGLLNETGYDFEIQKIKSKYSNKIK